MWFLVAYVLGVAAIGLLLGRWLSLGALDFNFRDDPRRGLSYVDEATAVSDGLHDGRSVPITGEGRE